MGKFCNDFTSSVKDVAPDVKVFVVHPGEGKKYFDFFYRSNIVFLNIPGMDLCINDFGNNELLRKKLRRTISIIDGKEIFPIETYSGEAKGISPLFGSFSALYARAKIGDLIIVPSRGYFEPFLIGEIISDYNDEDVIIIHSDEYKTPYRKVRWLRIDINKKRVSEALATQMINRKAVIEINDEDLIKEVLGLAYGKYTYKNTSKSYLSGSNYNSTNLEGIIDTLTAINMLAKKLNVADTLEIKINFNSPGGIGLISKGKIAIFIAGLASTCLSGCDYGSAQNEFQEYQEVSIGDGLCSPLMNSIDRETYDSFCNKITEAKQKIDLEVEYHKVLPDKGLAINDICFQK